jgi:hypothetical protein
VLIWLSKCLDQLLLIALDQAYHLILLIMNNFLLRMILLWTSKDFSHRLIGQNCKKIFLKKRIEIYGMLTVPDFQKEKETSLKSNGQEK